ncbi:MAG: L-lactate permease [Thermogemmatispora sp.]|jgi:L-lactate transport|uniref:L-lactate permease n=1 Tax=Thermogemmatispora aurantia TaxID=2045279 RepID=A0A5J4K3Z5_9CHLR|nr:MULTISPECIES: L-lactate permease [Thermogemmatispora]MBE3565523.1 L-lactate permease [Thermogemmatispora sp.]GER83384.1 glycolate permease GlcA [Thermogemmatispora aurantia]
MFHQLLTPVANNLFLSFLVGIIPIAVVLILLGVIRLPAWLSALIGLIVGLLIAVFVWQMPFQLAASSTLNGMVFALWPVMWIVWNAMWLYNVAVRSGKFELFRRWMVHNVPADRRILLLIIGFSFGALMEGISGFGTPVAICSALLIGLGFEPLDAIVMALIFNTTPVAFGALGVPITTLHGVTNLPTLALSAMVGRQLPIFSLLLPFYALVVYAGVRSLRTCWPAALVAGLSFALTQFAVSNFIGPELPDVLASLVSLLCVILFVQIWQPRDTAEYMAAFANASSSASGEGGTGQPTTERPTLGETLLAWLPWLLVSAVVIIWTFAGVAKIGQINVPWPNLHNAIYLTLYKKPYAAIYSFQPLGTGTAILLAMLLTAAVMIAAGARPVILWQALTDTWRQLRYAILTVMFIVGLAYLFNYSGISYTIGLAISSLGVVFPFFSVFLGWIACFLSGSDTSSNALFGNLQVVAAQQLKLSPILMAATNSSGAVMSKMISPQNLTTGASTIGLTGKEGLVVRRTFWHSIILACILGVIVMVQQYLIPGIIPQ